MNVALFMQLLESKHTLICYSFHIDNVDLCSFYSVFQALAQKGHNKALLPRRAFLDLSESFT